MTPEERQAARARCEAAISDCPERVLTHCPCGESDCAYNYLPAALDELDAKDAEIERLRGALKEVADTLENDGRFPNTVPAIRAALEGRE